LRRAVTRAGSGEPRGGSLEDALKPAHALIDNIVARVVDGEVPRLLTVPAGMLDKAALQARFRRSHIA
jgi:hypothetical protein